MMFQMLDRLSNEDRALLPGAIFAEQGNERRLPGMRVLAQPLACDGFVAAWSSRSSAIWNANPMSRAKPRYGVRHIGRKSPHDARRLDGELDEGSGLKLLQPVIEPMSRSCPSATRSSIWPRPSRSGRTRGPSQYQLGPDERIFVRGRVRDDFECQVVETVSGKHRRRFIIGAMHRRLAAPQVVVIHAWKIVMDQRIDMDRFDRGAGTNGTVFRNAEQLAGCRGKQRTEALAATARHGAWPRTTGLAHHQDRPDSLRIWLQL